MRRKRFRRGGGSCDLEPARTEVHDWMWPLEGPGLGCESSLQGGVSPEAFLVGRDPHQRQDHEALS